MIWIRYGLANNSYVKIVTVAVNIAAFSIISPKGMTGFKGELFGDSNIAHKSARLRAVKVVKNSEIFFLEAEKDISAERLGEFLKK